MNKKIQLLVLTTIIASQFSGIITNINLYASEVNSEVNSEVETSEIDSEIQENEVTSETISETNSEVPETELTQEESSELATTSNEITASIVIDEDGAISKQSRTGRSLAQASPTLKEGENETTYVNQERLENGSGESTIIIQPSARSSKQVADKEVYYILDEDGNIVSGSLRQPRSYNGNMITVSNGTIVEADSAIARTSGGYQHSFYIYNSLEDLKNNSNGIPISGGGFDATYIDTIEEDGKYYYQIKISGYEGYVAAENIQIVPEELMKSRSYYIAENGDWVYYSSMDAVNSTEYDRMELGEAPSEAEPGIKYYSNDDEQFSTRAIITPQTKASVYYNSYFMNLPFRSASNYTAADYKNYLSGKGYSKSTYYNSTSSFTDAQTLENVNSMMLFAMANHESAYGTSTYARACYNFFGRGAVDSDPDKACQQYGYNTARDGILAQALFLQNGYFDILDWRYSGTHAGNKSSGMNVTYASDVDWGKKLSNHAYMIDQYLAKTEENRYAILEVKSNSNVYTTSSLSTRVKSSGVSGKYDYYNISPQTSKNKTVTVVALLEENNAYQIYVPSSVKKNNSSDCSYTKSMKGSYPNYEGRKKLSVDPNTANYSCDYQSFGSQKYWISSASTSVINNKYIPSTTKVIYEYYPNGTKKFEFVIDTKTKVIDYAYGYDTAGNLIKKYLYFPDTVYGDGHGNKKKTIFHLKDDFVYQANTYNSEQKTIYVYRYYSGATLGNTGSKISYRFNINPNTGYITNTFGYANTAEHALNRIYVYEPNTEYGKHGAKVRYRFDFQDGTKYIQRAYRYNSIGEVERIYYYQPDTIYGEHSKNYKTIYYLKGNELEIDYAIGYNQDNERQLKYLYNEGTIFGKGHGSQITQRIYY